MIFDFYGQQSPLIFHGAGDMVLMVQPPLDANKIENIFLVVDKSAYALFRVCPITMEVKDVRFVFHGGTLDASSPLKVAKTQMLAVRIKTTGSTQEIDATIPAFDVEFEALLQHGNVRTIEINSLYTAKQFLYPFSIEFTAIKPTFAT